MTAETGGPAPAPRSSERGLFGMSSQFHEPMQDRTDRANCLPHGKLRCVPGEGPPLRQKASRTIRRAKGGMKSELRAVCDGALHGAATKVRLSLGSPIILAERSYLGSFRSLTCDEFVRESAHPDPLDFDGFPSFRQGH